MFSNIPEKIKKRMSYLENLDDEIRSGKRSERGLWQISNDAGKFLSLIASLAPDGVWIEIGTSGGYSGLWISLACGQRGTKLTTFETDAVSYGRARETFQIADVTDFIKPIHGDAKEYIKDIDKIAFCYLDGGDYEMFFDLVVPKLVKGGILVADNMIIPKGEHVGFVQKALNYPNLDAVVVNIGTGMLLGKRL